MRSATIFRQLVAPYNVRMVLVHVACMRKMRYFRLKILQLQKTRKAKVEMEGLY